MKAVIRTVQQRILNKKAVIRIVQQRILKMKTVRMKLQTNPMENRIQLYIKMELISEKPFALKTMGLHIPCWQLLQ